MMLSLFLKFFAFSYFALGGHLQIGGDPKLQLSTMGTDLSVTGDFELGNLGDESARDAFPEIQLGQWLWTGEPKNISPNQKNLWQINAKFPFEKLKCTPETCGLFEFPTQGYFPLRIQRHYQDVNGYRFSSPQVAVVMIGEPSKEALMAARVPVLSSKLKVEQSGDEFAGTVEIRNTASHDIKVSVSFHTANELQVLSPTASLTIKPQGIEKTNFGLKNYSALPGSVYAFFALLQWEEAGMRNATFASTSVPIGLPHTTPYFLYLAALSLVIGLGLFWFYFKRI